MKSKDLISGFYVFLHALKYKLTGSRVPLMVSLGLTRRCNLNCPFCYASDDRRQGKDCPTERLIDTIDQFVHLGTRIFLLQGGEPLLHEGLGDVISHIKRKKRYCRISTNGVLVPKRIDLLTGVDQISFSLDGTEEVADRIRGKGVYQRVVEGMKAAYERKIPFEIHASLIRESASNRESILHVLELARRFETTASFCVACVTGGENTKTVGSGDLTAEEIKELYRYLIQLKKDNYPIGNSFNSLHKTLDWPIHYSEIGFPGKLPEGFDYTECRHGRLICWLDGDVLYPCPTAFHRPEYAVAVANGDVKAAWKELGRKVRCVACSGSDESTSLFALNFEDLKAALFRVLSRR